MSRPRKANAVPCAVCFTNASTMDCPKCDIPVCDGDRSSAPRIRCRECLYESGENLTGIPSGWKPRSASLSNSNPVDSSRIAESEQ